MIRRFYRPRRLALLVALVGIILALAGPGSRRCVAHPANIAAATAKVQPDGHFQVLARFDLLAFVLDDMPTRIGDGPMNDLLDGPSPTLESRLTAAAGRLRRDFQVTSENGPGTIDSIVFPSLEDVQKWRDSGIKPRLPVMLPVTIAGHLPPGAATISLRFPDVLGMIVVTTEFPYREPTSEPIEAGSFSTPLPLIVSPPVPASPPVAPSAPLPAAVSPPFVKAAHARPIPKAAPAAKPVLAPTMAQAKPPVPALVPPVSLPAQPAVTTKSAAVPAAKPVPKVQGAAAPQAPPPPMPVASTLPSTPPLPWAVKVLRYVKMGYAHILPEGLDHILFVLGLFLLSTRTKALLWQITAFTMAHSLTLGLALYGVVRLPSSIVEPVIAASIAFVAIENILTTELKPWRPLVVFAFGLVHGMGFAGALRDLGLPRHDFLSALVGFNVGVELGQLSVVMMAFLAVGWFRSRPYYRRMVVVPASVAIAAVAVFWTFQRVL